MFKLLMKYLWQEFGPYFNCVRFRRVRNKRIVLRMHPDRYGVVHGIPADVLDGVNPHKMDCEAWYDLVEQHPVAFSQ